MILKSLLALCIWFAFVLFAVCLCKAAKRGSEGITEDGSDRVPVGRGCCDSCVLSAEEKRNKES